MKNLCQIAQKINIGPERVHFGEPMKNHTSFRIGGPADLFVEPGSLAELEAALGVLRAEEVPFFVLGGGANILVGDRGIRDAVLSLGGLTQLSRRSGGIWAEAGIPIDLLCENCLAFGLSGLENFYGMPGSLGGALYMNARCYEMDISGIAEEILALSPEGEIRSFAFSPDAWSYKHSPFQPGGRLEGWIVAGALFRLEEKDGPGIAAVMRARKKDRISKGHYRWPSAGSMFKNDRRFGKPTGAILDSLGLRGFRIGDAAVSPIHANIFVNLGSAKASDMKALIEYAAEKAFSAYGFRLEPEVCFVGMF
ncbi:MAG: UDP-N-acetylmuramate dehydrogenase [Spirochaetes bacterium]|nr:UDP-N-acetylmuramate dehydrogenase [Spirochaetota bacterium]